ncbi:MAG TPA: radical SAM protein [Anaerolineales bacterium]|nr:radical SAM protein [Anaerolineales bacterium]HRQ93064.1 radical SAM protein [Anaerolineales bacterium]
MALDTRSVNQFWQGVRSDTANFLSAFSQPEEPRIGLHTYDIAMANGRSMRIHLRFEPSGNGVLFIDVTDVVHLNHTAALMAKMALDGVPRAQARARIGGWHPDVPLAQIELELQQIYDMVDGFAHPDGDCPTCELSDTLEMSPMFSVEVNAPYKVDIALTYGCNNECPHCYNEANRLDMPSLPLTEWYAVLDRLAELGVPHLILTGGEATLHPDLPQVIRYADQLGMVVGLNTNGRHIAHQDYMQQLADAGLNHVQFTLDSSRAEVHNAMMGAKAWHQTVQGIENAVASRVHVITNTTLMRANMGHVEEIIEFLYSLGIRTFAMNGMIYSGGGFAHPNAIDEKEMPALLVRVRDKANEMGMRFLWYTPTEYCRMSPVELEIGAKRCNAGEYSLCIEPNGDVLPCQSYYVSAGNILHDPWEQIWDGELFQSFRYREQDPKGYGLPEKCWTCPDLPLCGGGCRIEREARDGVRISEGSGGGCSGCSGSCGTGASAHQVKGHVHTAGYIPTGGFTPSPSTTRTKTRASGNFDMIGLDDIL